MLLKNDMVKVITASGGGTLQARNGESLRVKKIICEPSTNDTFLKLKVDRVSVGYYRVKGKSGNHLAGIETGYSDFNLMEWLQANGIDMSIPVAEGQIFTIERYAETGSLVIVYDIYTAGDINSRMVNGSDSNEYIFINYGNHSVTPTASGDITLDLSLNPTEFPDFPFGDTVPARSTISLLGLVGSAWKQGVDASNHFCTQVLKLIKDRETLLSEDGYGIPFRGVGTPSSSTIYQADLSLIGPGVPAKYDSDTVTPGTPLLFSTPFLFEAGEELRFVVNLTKTGTVTGNTTSADLAAILRVVKG